MANLRRKTQQIVNYWPVFKRKSGCFEPLETVNSFDQRFLEPVGLTRAMLHSTASLATLPG